jgi:transcriptional regulator with XRE-family HTH domain
MARQVARRPLAVIVSARIREAQDEKGRLEERRVTNDEAARACGVITRLYQKWRAGDAVPNDGNIHRLAEFYGKPIAWFYSEDGTGAEAEVA